MASWLIKVVGGLGITKMMKVANASKALVIRINLCFLAFFLLAYAALLLSRPSTSSLYAQEDAVAAPLVRCSQCHHHKVKDGGVKMKAVLEEASMKDQLMTPNKDLLKTFKPTFMDEILGTGRLRIGTVNMDVEEVGDRLIITDRWQVVLQQQLGSTAHEVVNIRFDKVSELLEWKHLFPEWIDEEQEDEGGAICPEIPLPWLEEEYYPSLDVIVAKLPCSGYPKPGWARGLYRLQVHLVVANLAASKAKRDWFGRTKVVFLSQCGPPMLELFRCDDLVSREGDWWYYEPDMRRLDQKLALPVGSCKLALPLWGQQDVNEVYDVSRIVRDTKKIMPSKREAYATVLHSSETYVCGAITLGHSLKMTGTKRDLVLLIDKSISEPNREALRAAGWKIRIIKRIRNPRAEKKSYNEYNYSKFRLWQLTDYDKIVFIDSDIVVLRNLDLLFHFPQMSATGNDGSIFNSGIMVIEPSRCTFKMLMENRKVIVSYNGGDQGFLNEVFVWWHRLPRRVNFLKNYWSNSSLERNRKDQLFRSDPPQLYALHYLGLKPWRCYREYDCNWDIKGQHVYASDAAHERWWKLHDDIEEGLHISLHKICGLTKYRKLELDWNRRRAKKFGWNGDHWRINITDPRRSAARLLED